MPLNSFFQQRSQGPHLLDGAVRRLRPRWSRQVLPALLSRYERFAPPAWIDLPGGACLVVLAPHPDDESLGPGGLIAKWTAAGRRAEVIFLTDGAAGAPELRDAALGEEERSAMRARTIAMRADEARKALAVLGAGGHWLGGTDGALAGDIGRLTGPLAAMLDKLRPDLIAAPFPADRHADHFAAARLLVGAAGDRHPDLPVLAYEVWSPLPANAHLDIADVAERKWRAIAAHESQTRSTDYLAAQQALGRYRAICAGRPGPCEAFHRTDLRGYAAIARSLEV